jgi:nucleoside-diphosphate-sugar epimerase
MGYTQVPTAENVPLVIQDVYNPRWSYAASKTLGEVAVIANHHQYNLQFIILRIHNIYGPRMGLKHVIPDLIHKFNLGNMQVHGVNETRAFFYVNDLNRILYEFIFNEKIPSNLIYNVGSTQEISVLELSKLLLKEMNLDLEIDPIDSFVGSVQRRCPDTSLLRSYCKYTETDLIVGLKETLAWYKKITGESL